MDKNLRVGYVYIEKSFDTIFNVDYGVWHTASLPMGYGSGKSPMDARVKIGLAFEYILYIEDHRLHFFYI